MRILIVDDEALARSRLRDLLADIGGHQVVAEAANGQEALAQVELSQPDVVLLDIRMPVMDGMEAARRLAALPSPPAVIFTTAYDDQALQAFEADALDYLLKPIRRERLAKALDKVVPVVEVPTESATDVPHVCAHLRGNVSLIPLTEVYYFRADQKYTTVRHQGGEAVIDEPLKSLEHSYGDDFVRIHRNCLVAKRCVRSLTRSADGHYQLQLKGCDDVLEVSRRMVAHVRELIEQLAGGPN